MVVRNLELKYNEVFRVLPLLGNEIPVNRNCWISSDSRDKTHGHVTRSIGTERSF